MSWCFFYSFFSNIILWSKFFLKKKFFFILDLFENIFWKKKKPKKKTKKNRKRFVKTKIKKIQYLGSCIFRCNTYWELPGKVAFSQLCVVTIRETQWRSGATKTDEKIRILIQAVSLLFVLCLQFSASWVGSSAVLPVHSISCLVVTCGDQCALTCSESENLIKSGRWHTVSVVSLSNNM